MVSNKSSLIYKLFPNMRMKLLEVRDAIKVFGGKKKKKTKKNS